MIIYINDVNGEMTNAVNTTATIALFTTLNGYNTVTLQFSASDAPRVEDVMYYTVEHSIDGAAFRNFAQFGMDALFSAAGRGIISKEDFSENVRKYMKDKHCDVAYVTSDETFMEQLPSKKKDVEAILRSANAVYDYVFVICDGYTLQDVFGDYAYNKHADRLNPTVITEEGIEAKIDLTIWTARQGTKDLHSDIYHRFNNEIFVITDFDNNSKFTIKETCKRFKLSKRTPVYPLAKPIYYRDALDEGRLTVYMRRIRKATEELGSSAGQFCRNLEAILDAISGSPKEAEVWDIAEFPEGALELPEREADKVTLTRKELKAQKKDEDKRRKEEQAEAAAKKAAEEKAQKEAEARQRELDRIKADDDNDDTPEAVYSQSASDAQDDNE